MRLLHTSSLTLHAYFDKSVPAYGILSHTWAENEEVSYQEMSNLSPSVKAKTGYKKIINCAHTIKELGYDYVWIDTCCIDKSSSAELSESINSMYKFYKNSKVCLAYMADVRRDTSLDERSAKDVIIPVEFLKNFGLEKYPTFKRVDGLQELIAPTNVVFYDSDWQVIAKIQEIVKAVGRLTEIPEPVLLFGISESFSYCVAEKMRWASKRSTTRREDMAYCLLGLFDINMPLLYGEGDRAFERLQEEILKRSDDLSLFLWQDDEDSEYVHRGLLARSPAEFSKFSVSWRSVDVAWTLPNDFHHKTWITPKHPCWITNIGVQLRICLLEARSFWKSANSHADCFFDNPKDDEYVFNVINFKVGSNLICFYILLKRLEEDGNQFGRVLPGRISQLGCLEGHDDQPLPKLETIFIRQKLKVEPTIIDPRIYGFSISIGLSGRSTLVPLIQKAADVFGKSCSGGLMGKRDGNILLPAVVSQDGIVSGFLIGFLITLSQMSIPKTYCVVVNYQPSVDIPELRADLKYFDGEAARELCSTSSFSDMSTELEGMRVPNMGGSGILALCTGYTLDRGRVLVGITINILDHKSRRYTAQQAYYVYE
jgi:hypothetical protein